MDETVRWVTKAAASEELEISLSTLDRKIRKGEIEVVREGRRVYVRMHGPEYPNDEEVLRRAIARDNELEPTVRELERKASEVELRASELERERDEARESASAIGQRYEKLQQTYGKEREAHESTKSWVFLLGLLAAVLLVISVCFVAAAGVGVGTCYAKARGDRENAGFGTEGAGVLSFRTARRLRFPTVRATRHLATCGRREVSEPGSTRGA